MSDDPVRPRKSPHDVAAQASITAAIAQARERHALARGEYEERTKGLLFVKEFHDHNHAVMRDPFETVGNRVLAWSRRYAWGEYSLFAKGVDGYPKYQVDCCRELGISKRAVSKAVRYHQLRGYLEDQPKLIIPVIAPVMGGPAPGAEAKSPEWGSFLETWKVANSADFETLEGARATVTRIRQVRLAEYKKWREQETNRRATLLEIAREGPGDQAGYQSPTPFQESCARLKQQIEAKNNLPVEGGMQFTGQMGHAAACDFLYREISRMQAAYPKSTFSQPPIDRNDPDHEHLLNLLVKKLGSTDEEYLVGYVIWVSCNFKGLAAPDSKLARQRPPGSGSGPKTLGLLVNWAEDYARISGAPGSRTRVNGVVV